MVIEALAPLERPLVIATAGRGGELSPRPGLWVADFLPGEAIAAKACAVVCNGGSPTTQQALLQGVPVVGIVGNLDQLLNMDYIERFGAGMLVRADGARAKVVCEVTQCAIERSQLRERARAVAALATKTKPEMHFPSAMRLVFDDVSQTSPEPAA
jgi:UDP:flavonoid glycosyltransferase YjiC (YdhE family)